MVIMCDKGHAIQPGARICIYYLKDQGQDIMAWFCSECDKASTVGVTKVELENGCLYIRLEIPKDGLKLRKKKGLKKGGDE